VAHGDLTVNGQMATNARAWAQLLAALRERDVVMIQPQEVAWHLEKGMALIDIRTEKQFADGFIEGAVNVPLFQPIQKWDAFNVVRRLGYAAFGILEGTEPNPEFLERASRPRQAVCCLCMSPAMCCKRALIASFEVQYQGVYQTAATVRIRSRHLTTSPISISWMLQKSWRSQIRKQAWCCAAIWAARYIRQASRSQGFRAVRSWRRMSWRMQALQRYAYLRAA
jgi:hypothetical protein